jgi:hypothetical protein
VTPEDRHAPAHLVDELVRAMGSARPVPADHPSWAALRAQAGRWLDGVWTQAYHLGAAYGLSLQPATLRVPLAPAGAGGDAAVLRELEQRLGWPVGLLDEPPDAVTAHLDREAEAFGWQ